MLRRKSFHKSSPSLQDHATNGRSSLYVGRDELTENYLDLRDQHQNLRREANRAKEEIRLLQVKLNRLIEEKKRHYRLHKSDREITLEEVVYDLEHRIEEQHRQNVQLKQKMHLMHVGGATHTTTTTSLHQRVQNRRISSAVQPRIDSGLRGHSNGHLRPFSSTINRNRKQVNFDVQSRLESESARQQTVEMDDARSLLAEARHEILRLESLAEEQQELLESMLLKNATTPEYSTASYQLLTTTTTTTMASNGSSNQNQSSTNGQSGETQLQSTVASSCSNLDQLLAQYQRIMLQSEASTRIGAEVRSLIESLHTALQEERRTTMRLGNELAMTSAATSGLKEKDRQIETLRKENTILQQSMSECMEKCMELVELPSINNVTSAANEHHLQEMQRLKSKLVESERRSTVQHNELVQLRAEHSKLEQLSENDQLQVRHLEAKIQRLTRLVFQQELDSDPDTADPETISAQIDQILNSIAE